MGHNEIEQLLHNIERLELSEKTPLDWWSKEKAEQIALLFDQIQKLKKSLTEDIPHHQLEKLLEFFHNLQWLYKLHDKEMKKNISIICNKYRVTSVKQLDQWIDQTCHDIRDRIEHPPTISVVVSMWNGREDILQMTENMFFSGLLKHGLPNMEIIIVDDASPMQKETDEMLMRVTPVFQKAGHKVIILKSPKNLGYTHSYNIGLRKSTGNIIFVMNSDIRIMPGTMNAMIKLMLKNDEMVVRHPEIKDLNIGIVGPMLTNCGHYVPQLATKNLEINSYDDVEMSKIDHFGSEFNNLNKAAPPLAVKFVVGSFMAIKREVFKKAGFFDEKFKQGYVEESDFAYKAKKKGFDTLVARNVFVFHGGVERDKTSVAFNYSSQSQGVKLNHKHTQWLATKNELYFARNHGFLAFIEKALQFRPFMHKHVPNPIDPNQS